MLDFIYNDRSKQYTARVSDDVRYIMGSWNYVTVVREERYEAKLIGKPGTVTAWHITHSSPQKEFLAYGPARAWANALAAKLGDI